MGLWQEKNRTEDISELEEKMQELISIVVPIYKVEKYLELCVDSILGQTYKNLEVILVDDGSPDGCPQICDDYAKKDSRVKVIHRKNGGLSAARNSGIEIATGDYIGFVDSDDYIHFQMYEILLNHLKEKQADLAVCGVLDVFNMEQKDAEIVSEQLRVMTNMEAMKGIYREYGTDMVVAWNKLYKKEIFDTICYNEGKIHEDEFMIHKVLNQAEKVVCTDAKLYYYQRGNVSIMRTGGYSLVRLQGLEAVEDRISLWEEKADRELLTMLYISYFDGMIISYFLVKKYFNDRKDIYQELRHKFFQVYRKKEKQINLNLKYKMKYLLYRCSPSMYSFVRGGFDSEKVNRKAK